MKHILPALGLALALTACPTVPTVPSTAPTTDGSGTGSGTAGGSVGGNTGTTPTPTNPSATTFNVNTIGSSWAVGVLAEGSVQVNANSISLTFNKLKIGKNVGGCANVTGVNVFLSKAGSTAGAWNSTASAAVLANWKKQICIGTEEEIARNAVEIPLKINGNFKDHWLTFEVVLDDAGSTATTYAQTPRDLFAGMTDSKVNQKRFYTSTIGSSGWSLGTLANGTYVIDGSGVKLEFSDLRIAKNPVGLSCETVTAVNVFLSKTVDANGGWNRVAGTQANLASWQKAFCSGATETLAKSSIVLPLNIAGALSEHWMTFEIVLSGGGTVYAQAKGVF
jgi:hypothetical protein